MNPVVSSVHLYTRIKLSAHDLTVPSMAIFRSPAHSGFLPTARHSD